MKGHRNMKYKQLKLSEAPKVFFLQSSRNTSVFLKTSGIKLKVLPSDEESSWEIKSETL